MTAILWLYLPRAFCRGFLQWQTVFFMGEVLWAVMPFEQLDAKAGTISDNGVAQRLNDAWAMLFKTI